MKIETLHLEQFKNYQELTLHFNRRITSLVGVNGAGKTNILDSIYYLGHTKSAFGSSEVHNILHNKNYFLIKGNFSNSSKAIEVKAYFEKNQKKIFRLDDVDYEKLSDHIGEISMVLSTPYDVDIIRDSSEARRKWADGCISVSNKGYLKTLIKFQKTLKQRNALLKQANGILKTNLKNLLTTYDDLVIKYSKSLAKSRKEFTDAFLPFFYTNVKALVLDLENCHIKYNTRILDNDFEEAFRTSRVKDIILQRTTLGSHKDDFIFYMDDQPIKRFGSQGQQKTFLIALRLAQFDYITSKKKVKPILLLDDVFDKLDDQRIKNLVTTLKTESRFDQVIITDARRDRTEAFFRKYNDLAIIEIENGALK